MVYGVTARCTTRYHGITTHLITLGTRSGKIGFSLRTGSTGVVRRCETLLTCNKRTIGSSASSSIVQ